MPAEHLDAVWNEVARPIGAALRRGGDRFTLGDIYRALVLREMQLWIAVDRAASVLGLAITEIRHYPNRKVCAVLICTGRDAKLWLDHVDGIMAWAKTQGCQTFEAWSRKGWARLFKGKLKLTHVMLERDL